MYVYTEDDPTVLVHYGRQGMRWYQHIFGDDPRWGKKGRNGKSGKQKSQENLDYSEDGNEPSEHPEKTYAQIKTKRQLKKATKRAYEMTDEELNTRIERLSRQKMYTDLLKSQMPDKSSMLKDVLKKVGKTNLEGLGYGASSIVSGNIAKRIVALANEVAAKGDEKKAESLKDLAAILAMTSTYTRNKTNKKK